MPGMLSLEPNAMATENEGVPPSTEVSPLDLQLSACAIEGTHAHISSNTVRLAVGQLIGGRYRIERELGEGGMGVVYLATDDQVPGERFAVKVLKEEPRPEALALLCEEVHKTRKLSHPNIVDVHSVNVDGQTLYVLMEYLEGKSLDKLLDEEFGRGMSFSHAWPIIEDVGAALGNAHDHNVIHSDLKPANLFVTTSGRTKLLDFGIARVSRGPLLHARTGPLALTPSYASCEMLEGKQADRRDDIYSFACVIYEMLCGDRPFGELTALEAREAGTKVPPLEGLSREQNAALVGRGPPRGARRRPYAPSSPDCGPCNRDRRGPRLSGPELPDSGQVLRLQALGRGSHRGRESSTRTLIRSPRRCIQYPDALDCGAAVREHQRRLRNRSTSRMD